MRDTLEKNLQLRPLLETELDAVNGGFMEDLERGVRGCTTVLNPMDPRFPEWVALPNGWLPGGIFR